MSTFVGWVIVFFLSTLEKFKEFFQKPKKQKDFFSNHEIILHDDENQVGKSPFSYRTPFQRCD